LQDKAGSSDIDQLERRKLLEQIELLKKHNQNLNIQINQLDNQNKIRMEEIKQLKSHLEHLTDLKSQLQIDYSSLSDNAHKIHLLEENQQKLLSELAEYDNRFKNLFQDMEILKSEREKLLRDLEHIEADSVSRKTYQADIERLSSQLNEKNKIILDLLNEGRGEVGLDDLKARIQNLESERAKIVLENRRFKDRYGFTDSPPKSLSQTFSITKDSPTDLIRGSDAPARSFSVSYGTEGVAVKGKAMMDDPQYRNSAPDKAGGSGVSLLFFGIGSAVFGSAILVNDAVGD